MKIDPTLVPDLDLTIKRRTPNDKINNIYSQIYLNILPHL